MRPLEPKWKKIKIKPQLGSLEYAETGNETVAGKVAVKVTKVNTGMDIELPIPQGSEAVVCVPIKNKKITLNGKKISSNEKELINYIV